MVEKKEGFDEHGSIDYWYARVLRSQEGDDIEGMEQKMLEALRNETPNLVSATLERACNLSCSHCLFQDEHSSFKISQEARVAQIVENLVRQLPTAEESSRHAPPWFLDDGRILMPWHLELFDKIRAIRPDVGIGIIDNGTYTNFLDEFEKHELRLDALNVSIDGMEESHDTQRDPIKKRAYRDAIHGLEHGREVVKPYAEGGRVSSLMTLTSVNYRDTGDVADFLFSPNQHPSARNPENGDQLSYADELVLSTMNPLYEADFDRKIGPHDIEISKEQMAESWEQIKQAVAKHPERKISLRIYRNADFEKLLDIVGSERVRDILNEDAVDVNGDGIEMKLDGVPVIYFPQSIWPSEGILVDSDGAQRVAYSQPYTLAEHSAGKDKNGRDITGYTVQKLVPNSNLVEAHHKVVDHWWEHFGKKYLKEESTLFKKVYGTISRT